jgi:hypothetical protein
MQNGVGIPGAVSIHHRLPERWAEGLERRPACDGGRSHCPLRHCWLGFDPTGANLVTLTPSISFTLVTSSAARALSLLMHATITLIRRLANQRTAACRDVGIAIAHID